MPAASGTVVATLRTAAGAVLFSVTSNYNSGTSAMTGMVMVNNTGVAKRVFLVNAQGAEILTINVPSTGRTLTGPGLAALGIDTIQELDGLSIGLN